MQATEKDVLRRLEKNGDYRTYVEAANVLAGASDSKGLPPLRLAVLRNVTVEPLLPVISGEIGLAGFSPVTYLGPYDNIMQDVLDANGELYAFDPDLIVLMQWLENIAPRLTGRFLSFEANALDAELDRILSDIGAIIAGLRQHTQKPVLLNNFPLPAHPVLGVLDAQEGHYQTNVIVQLNRSLLDLAKQWSDVYIVDFMSLLGRIGAEVALDPRLWHVARMPFSREALVPLGQMYGQFIRALKGKTRKCLILDCDNTLWGGIVGEDHLSGIQIGDDYPGSCFKALQQQILAFNDRGTILALCSKNNENDVLDVLRNHPDMLIREDHLATWRINWENKVSNIRSIAEELNIGLDSVVYVDDSAFECNLVSSYLPEVRVIQLVGEPTDYARMLSGKAGLDSLSYSQEDRKRTQMYRADSERRQIAQGAENIEDYLAQLGMEAVVGVNDLLAVPRVSQLTQKTNQFNLTTRRYTQGEIDAFAADPHVDILHLKLSDKVSDLGIIGVAILRYAGKEAQIDSFMLSCRAIGRNAEDVLMQQILLQSRVRECEVLRGWYYPTARNQQVADFYARFGMSKTRSDKDGWEWVVDVVKADFTAPSWINVVPVTDKDKGDADSQISRPERAYG